MTSLRTILETVGIVTVAVGLLLLVSPSLAANVTIPEAAVTILGVIALVEGLRSVQQRRDVDINQAEPPAPEKPIDTPMPGDEFDRSIGPGRIGAARVRRRLIEAATESVSIRHDVDTAEAERRIEDGSWTDDPVAAAYLGGPEVSRPPFRTRLRLIFDTRSRHRYFAERTIDAIDSLWEER